MPLFKRTKKEVIKMAEDRDPGQPEQTQMGAAKRTLTERLEMLEERLKKLRAERNAVARALRGLGKFY